MPKRSSNESTASQRRASTRFNKRAKVDQTDTGSTLNTPVDVEEDIEKDTEENLEESTTVLVVHDSKYYFEDGNVIIRVCQILFKVHSSLLKAHSEDIFNIINPSVQSNHSTVPGGTCDENAIDIPDIQPSQFHNLLRVVYCLPSNNVVFDNNKAVVDAFDCYLDMALLSRKFGMEAMQKWAKNKLSNLAHNSGKSLVVQLDDYYAKEMPKPDSRWLGNYVPDEVDKEDSVSPASLYNAVRFVEALQYARDISQRTLLHNMLIILESYFSNPDHKVKMLILFFRIPGLRESDPSLFGFLFLLLLDRGNRVWVMGVFTQENRMALFSAQSFLTPLPESLKTDIIAPLFTRPTNANEFAAMFSGDTKCSARCLQGIFPHWEKAFPSNYYDDVNNKEFAVSIKALATLPLHRMNFVIGLRRVKCQKCRQKTLDELNQNMQEVFARLAEYYKVYD
ncbi:unnamed protein product [Rhizoctonia solani]|uniref:BTB domain-containing protein n=1 Tax=Rhizoctonia solani TaxID=456999 RepID=A0A8H3C077_9AGAM|nr:unnamed protein product [Rhizoctonia solani]